MILQVLQFTKNILIVCVWCFKSSFHSPYQVPFFFFVLKHRFPCPISYLETSSSFPSFYHFPYLLNTWPLLSHLILESGLFVFMSETEAGNNGSNVTRFWGFLCMGPIPVILTRHSSIHLVASVPGTTVKEMGLSCSTRWTHNVYGAVPGEQQRECGGLHGSFV